MDSMSLRAEKNRDDNASEKYGTADVLTQADFQD